MRKSKEARVLVTPSSFSHHHLCGQDANWNSPLLSWGSSASKVMGSSLLSGVPGGAVVGNPAAKAGDTGSSPGPGGYHVLQSN